MTAHRIGLVVPSSNVTVQMPSLDLIGPAEEEFGLPVLSAATAGACALLHHLGLLGRLPGAGRLLAAPALQSRS